MSYNMKANFYPANEPKNGYIGIADLTISNAIRIRGIAVFENAEDKGKHHIQFPGYGEGDARRSYVIPKSQEAYAEMLSVVEKAIADTEKHFGWVSGEMNPRLEVSGIAVQEPYADARFNLAVGDLCTVTGIATREVEYENSAGNPSKFVAVDMPQLAPYEKDGKKVYPDAVEGLVSKYEKDGKEKSKDFGVLINNLVRGERNKVLDIHPNLDEQVKNAEQRTAAAETGKESPAPEKAR